MQFYQDKVRPTKNYRRASEAEKTVISKLRASIAALDPSADAEEIQSAVYAAGKESGYENLRDWFACLYETMLGQSQDHAWADFSSSMFESNHCSS